MVGPKDVVLAQLDSSNMLIETMTKELTDEEYFRPAAEGTNHVGWILGHLATTEDYMVSLLTDHSPAYPQGTRELFQGGNPCLADSSKYPSRKELDEMFRHARAVTVEALRSYAQAKWEDPSPEELPSDFFPTCGAVWALQPSHAFWHIGQLTTCRAVLGKKGVMGMG